MGQIKNIKLHIVTDIKTNKQTKQQYNTMLSSVVRRTLSTTLKHHLPVTSSIQQQYVHSLPDLEYDYGALEPVISGEIMQLHHSKHHQTYVNNLNVAEEQLAEAQQKGDVSKMISLAPSLKFNGGGHLNHSIFWTNLSPNGGGEPTGDLLTAINNDFGSFDNMKTKLSASTVAVQGSGWGWLGYNKGTG